jgi:large subunit ribosomal protein L18
MNKPKSQKRIRNHKKIRTQVAGTETRPRLAVFKSNTAIYAQVINDDLGVTLVSAKGTDAKKVGAEVAKAAMSKSVEAVVFDRGGYIYTGKVKDLAEAAREAGLKF